MAKKTAAPAAAPRPVLSAEEQAAFRLKWSADRVRSFKAEAQKTFEKAQADLASDIAKGYELSWSLAPKYVVAREIYNLAAMYLEMEGKSDAEAIERGREVRKVLGERMISNHSGMHSGGDLNSTNPFSRAIQAAKWSALYEVHNYLSFSIGE